MGVWSSGLWSPQALVKGTRTSWARQALITGMVQAGGAPLGTLGTEGHSPETSVLTGLSGHGRLCLLGRGPPSPRRQRVGWENEALMV